MSIGVLALVIFAIAVVMTMTGRGGGNFYVLAIVLSGIGMHTAATTGQFILIVSSLVASILFGKKKITDWKLVALIGSMTLFSAFLGGFMSDVFNDRLLKIIFAIFISIASLLMLKPVKKELHARNRFTYVIKSGSELYNVNLLIVVPVVLLTGFISGMVGISGGSFLVPLMVLAIRVPMHLAVGTSTTLVMITATAGFLGHLSLGHFDFQFALPLALAGLVGGLIGAKLTLKFKPKNLKVLFAVTSLIAAILMLFR
jgi:uncharacterized membrane protein YfcA